MVKWTAVDVVSEPGGLREEATGDQVTRHLLKINNCVSVFSPVTSSVNSIIVYKEFIIIPNDVE